MLPFHLEGFEVTKVRNTRNLKLETEKARGFEIRNIKQGFEVRKFGIPVRAFSLFSSSVTCSSAAAIYVGRKSKCRQKK
jgi:hypothetical protein